MAADAPRVYYFAEVAAVIDALPGEAVIQAMADGFVAFSRGLVSVPPPQTLGQPPLAAFIGHSDAQACIKSGYEHGAEVFVTKVASGGGGSNSGLVMIFSQRTFRPQAILLDEGLLTELRTAAAGALAARNFAPKRVEEIAVIGAGVQARWQLRLLAHATTCRKVKVWARSPDKCQQLMRDVAQWGWQVELAPDAASACQKANLVITVTPSRAPLVPAGCVLGRDVLICAIGADAAGKCELDPAILEAADLLVADSRAQCFERGELQHLASTRRGNVVEIGEWIARGDRVCERPRLVVFDSTGVAVQDIKAAELALRTLMSGSRL